MPMTTECRHIRERMDSYIGGELTVETNHDVLRHLEGCEACRTELGRRERLRVLLVESFGAAPDATALESRIARAIDHEERRWWRLAQYGSMAAAVLLVVGAAVWMSRPVDAAAFDDSVDDHIACALTYPPAARYNAQRVAESLEPAYRNIVHAVAHRSGNYELIDGHMCPYQGRNYAHLVYRDGDYMLSVFVEAATRGRLPRAPDQPRKGFVSAGASTRRHQVFVVTADAAHPPPEVVSGLLQSSLTFARTLER
jgi:anti-sigma factor RsiW